MSKGATTGRLSLPSALQIASCILLSHCTPPSPSTSSPPTFVSSRTSTFLITQYTFTSWKIRSIPTMAPIALLSLENATLDNTVGALFLGVLATMFLFGITTLQTFWYYHLFPKDSQLHKYSLCKAQGSRIYRTLDALHLALTIHAVYTYIVTGFGDRAGLEYIVCSDDPQTTQSEKLSTIQYSSKYRSTYMVHTYTELENVSWVIVAAFATSTGIDFVITAAMCYYLWKSQVPTSSTAWALGFSQVYILSFLTMLNARKRTSNHSNTNGMLSETNQSETAPVTDLVPRCYKTLRNKFHQCSFSIGSNASIHTHAHIRVHRVVRPATSSFWSPPPPPTPGEDEHEYKDFLPSNLDLENGQTAALGGCERSLSDDSETIRGTLKSPLSPISPMSTETLLRSPLQHPASIYDGEARVSRTSADVRHLSTSYPWHAR
ncbi:hypothetical protein D9756_009958 [Leucocoprinus leucothites]|uniref:Uncharacterized protein n=1 Tax=Leucocoprinus leucothites TaxID=201217 RepID=A0A8H5CSQ7_9AGAR|nr:hypothetical protein D9756_009958 [Leucoagaricus leucothites]